MQFIRQPFQDAVDAAFFFSGGTRREIVDEITGGLARGVQLITLIGGEGSGKTMICRIVQQELPEGIDSVFLPRTVQSFGDAWKIVSREVMGDWQDESGQDPKVLLSSLAEVLRERGRRLLIVFDEAEKIFLATLERIRKMIDQLNREGLVIQVILAGRPQLEESLEQLSIVTFEDIDELHLTLENLDIDATRAYLNHCMRLATGENKTGFPKDAVEQIFSISDGNFKVINQLARDFVQSEKLEDSFLVLLDNLNGAESGRKRKLSRRSRVTKGMPNVDLDFLKFPQISLRWLLYAGGFCVVALFLLLFFNRSGDTPEPETDVSDVPIIELRKVEPLEAPKPADKPFGSEESGKITSPEKKEEPVVEKVPEKEPIQEETVAVLSKGAKEKVTEGSEQEESGGAMPVVEKRIAGEPKEESRPALVEAKPVEPQPQPDETVEEEKGKAARTGQPGIQEQKVPGLQAEAVQGVAAEKSESKTAETGSELTGLDGTRDKATPELDEPAAGIEAGSVESSPGEEVVNTQEGGSLQAVSEGPAERELEKPAAVAPQSLEIGEEGGQSQVASEDSKAGTEEEGTQTGDAAADQRLDGAKEASGQSQAVLESPEEGKSAPAEAVIPQPEDSGEPASQTVSAGPEEMESLPGTIEPPPAAEFRESEEPVQNLSETEKPEEPGTGEVTVSKPSDMGDENQPTRSEPGKAEETSSVAEAGNQSSEPVAGQAGSGSVIVVKPLGEKKEPPSLPAVAMLEGEQKKMAPENPLIEQPELTQSPAARYDIDSIYKERVTAGARWLVGSSTGKFTVQLMVLTSEKAEENLKKMLSERDFQAIADNLYILRKLGDLPTVMVYYGEYRTLAAARKARNTLPVFLRRHDPYAISVNAAVEKTKSLQ